jgi:hypothetical protein
LDDIYALSIDRYGNILGDTALLTGGDLLDRIVGNGNGYACIVKKYMDPGMYFRLIDRAGNQIGSESLLTTGDYSPSNFSIKTAGNSYAVSWSQSDQIYTSTPYVIKFAILDSSGNLVVLKNNITALTGSYVPSLAWSGIEYGIAFCYYQINDPNTGIVFTENYLVRLNSQGNNIGSDIKITDINTDP